MGSHPETTFPAVHLGAALSSTRARQTVAIGKRFSRKTPRYAGFTPTLTTNASPPLTNRMKRSNSGLVDRGVAKEKNSGRDRLEHAPSHADEDRQSGIKSNDVAKMNTNLKATTMATPSRKTPVPGSILGAREEPQEGFGIIRDDGGFEAASRRADDHGLRGVTTNGNDASLVSGGGKGGAGVSTTVPGSGAGNKMAGEQVRR